MTYIGDHERKMMRQDEAQHFAEEWISGWNSHDLSRILSHYAEDIEFNSPFVVALLGEETGTLAGKAAIENYFGRALAKYQDLRFTLDAVFTGHHSVTVCYESVNKLQAAEVMEFDTTGRVGRVLAHYRARD